MINVICFVSLKPGMSWMPSTALRILIAGVMTPSPTNSEIPIKVRMVINTAGLLFFRYGKSIFLSTIVPPSPFSPRLMASQPYSTETRIISVQTISESTPITFSYVGFKRIKITVRV